MKKKVKKVAKKATKKAAKRQPKFNLKAAIASEMELLANDFVVAGGTWTGEQIADAIRHRSIDQIPPMSPEDITTVEHKGEVNSTNLSQSA